MPATFTEGVSNSHRESRDALQQSFQEPRGRAASSFSIRRAASGMSCSSFAQPIAGSPGTEEVVRSFLPEQQQVGHRVICGCLWSPNMRVLGLTALLFTVITIAQTAGALISHSQALLADCVSMAVDAATYVMNMAVETQQGKSYHRPLELVAASVSQAMLVYFTVDVLREAISSLYGSGEDEDDVNPWIVFAFAVWGLLFDCCAMYAFVRNQRRTATSEVNMVSALSHVAADFARSTTTLVESVIIFANPSLSSANIDAWAAILVSATILLGASVAIKELLLEIYGFIRSGE